jgi:hypothetical protein
MPTIVTRAEWGARAPKSASVKTTWSKRTGFAIHHTAGPTSQTVRQIQNFQMDSNGWSDIGYNWLVDQAGKVYEGRSGGWLAIGAHAGGQNTAWVGVCWIGTSGNTAPTPAALASIRWLHGEANRLAGRTLTVRGHGQVPGQSTECPGSRLRAWIAAGLPTTEEDEDMPYSDWPQADKTALIKDLREGLSSVVGETYHAATSGAFDVGDEIDPRTALRQAWVYGKLNLANTSDIPLDVWNRVNPQTGQTYGAMVRGIVAQLDALAAALEQVVPGVVAAVQNAQAQVAASDVAQLLEVRVRESLAAITAAESPGQ